MLILGIPNLNPATSVLRRLPTLFSVPGDLWATLAACRVPILSPLGGPLPHLLNQHPHLQQEPSSGSRVGLWGTWSILCAASYQRSSINCLNWASPRSLRAMQNCSGGLSSGWGLLGETGKPPPSLGSVCGCQRGICPLQLHNL